MKYGQRVSCSVWKVVIVALLLTGWPAVQVIAGAESADAQAVEAVQDDPYQQAAAEMRAIYEARLDTLSDDKQRHYGQRLWRLTGDPDYLVLNETYGKQLMAELADYDAVVHTEEGITERNQQLLESYSTDSAKNRRRRAMFSERVDMLLPTRLLFRLAQAHYHGLLNELSPQRLTRLETAVMAVDWEAFLTDPEVLSIYAAQVANDVAFLHQLGLIDLRSDVMHAFQKLYPEERIATLSQAEYRNWLYGMTHIVIAYSHYYQRLVPEGEVSWIIDAFQREGPRLVDSVKEDILAEIALSMQLAGREDLPLVDVIRDHLLEMRDPDVGIIPGDDGDLSLSDGEHRNVLTIMVLGWSGQLTPGPDLGDWLQVCRSESEPMAAP